MMIPRPLGTRVFSYKQPNLPISCRKRDNNPTSPLPPEVSNKLIILFKIGKVILPKCFFLFRQHVEYHNYFWTSHFKKGTDKPKWCRNVSGEVSETRTTSYRKLLLEARILS